MFARKSMILGLVAVAAAFGLAPSAKADLQLTVVQSGSGTASPAPTTYTFAGNTFSGGAAVLNLDDGYSLTINSVVAAPNLPGFGVDTPSQSIQLSAILSSSAASGSSIFSISLASISGNTLFSITGSPSSGVLSQALSASFSGNFTSADGVTATGSVINATNSTTLGAAVSPSAFTNVGPGTPGGFSVQNRDVGGVTNYFGLKQLNTTLTSSGGGITTSFVSTTTYAVPEPASILAGLLGLPCVGGVVSLVRRRVGGAVLA